MSILFRCDGSVEIGMGHVVRCLALAKYLKKFHKIQISFIMNESYHANEMIKESFPVITLGYGNSDYKSWFSKYINENNIKILIIDVRDDLKKNDLKYIKHNTGVKIVTIDDNEEKRLATDMAFYPPVPQLNLMNWNGYKGKVFSGFEYFILREEFTQICKLVQNDTPKILVSMGGTDSKNITKKVLNTFVGLNKKFEIVVLLGKRCPHISEIRNFIKEKSINIDLKINPTGLIHILKKIDLGIVSFGITAYELAALGIPSLYFCHSNDHEMSSRVFVKRKMGSVFGVSENIDLKLLKDRISSFIENNDYLFKKDFPKLKISNLPKITKKILSLLDPH